MRMLVPCLLLGGLAYAGSNVTVIFPPQAPATNVIMVPAVAPEEPAPPPSPVRPTSYLIAFKGGTVRIAANYWVNGSTLVYLTPDREKRTAPVATVDRALSERLNLERNVVFRLPAVERPTTARARPVRHTGSATRKCCCVTVTK